MNEILFDFCNIYIYIITFHPIYRLFILGISLRFHNIFKNPIESQYTVFCRKVNPYL